MSDFKIAEIDRSLVEAHIDIRTEKGVVESFTYYNTPQISNTKT